jgi:DNA replication protein DnaC
MNDALGMGFGQTLDDFDFKFQPSVDQKLVRELATAHYVANAENVLIFGPTDPATSCYTSLTL